MLVERDWQTQTLGKKLPATTERNANKSHMVNIESDVRSLFVTFVLDARKQYWKINNNKPCVLLRKFHVFSKLICFLAVLQWNGMMKWGLGMVEETKRKIKIKIMIESYTPFAKCAVWNTKSKVFGNNKHFSRKTINSYIFRLATPFSTCACLWMTYDSETKDTNSMHDLFMTPTQ